MRVRVLFFGPIAELLGRREEELDLAASCAQDIFDHYQRLCPEIGRLGRDLLLAVNREFCPADTQLHADDEIALIPPMSGGSPAAPSTPAPAQPQPRVALTREPLEIARLLAAVRSPSAGAVVVFAGDVRGYSRGRAILWLEYEAYEAMALGRLRALTTEARQRFSLEDLVLVHRLGRLQPGECSVVIAVAAAHRQPAFDACSWLLESLKRSVPIWKKEYSPEGAFWPPGDLPEP